MRVQIFTLAIPLLATVAFAQGTPPTQPQTAAPSNASTPDKAVKDKTKDKDKTMGEAATAHADEMKTQKYSGTLSDASCAGSGAMASAPAAAGSADRSTAGADKSCSVSASTTQFALTMKDGKVVKFDDIGNMRAQEAFKARKKWSDAASSGKPIRISAGGILSGDKMTVTSIN
jgi:hypothetical protein